MKRHAAGFAAALWVSACSGSVFPKGFLWGASTSGFQVDMGCPTLPASECDDPNSDWYAFVNSRDLPDLDAILSHQSLSAEPGFWETYDSDLALAKDGLGLSALRMSLEWSRIFPTATDALDGYDALKASANKKALERYHQMFASFKARGLKPFVTINHYTLPLWIHDGIACHKDLDHCTNRGWLDHDRIVKEISKFAGFVAREFGGEVDLWATLNEPFAVVLPGFLIPSAERLNPPALGFKTTEAKQVMVAMIDANAAMYDAVKANDLVDGTKEGTPARVGFVYNLTPAGPANPKSPLDKKAAENIFYLYNTSFLDGALKGDVDATLTQAPVHRPELEHKADFVGLNYYTRVIVEGEVNPSFPALSPLTTFNPLTFSVWNDDPTGFYEALMFLTNRYKIPVYISENGIPDPNDEGIAPSYLARHLQFMKRAMKDGADVRGYFYWSLLDNYEWNHGMAIRYGLYAVDPNDVTKKRVPRKTVETYRSVVSKNDLPSALVSQYPTDAGAL